MPRLAVAASVFLIALVVPATAGAATFDPLYELSNYNKGNERALEYGTPAYQSQLALRGNENEQAALGMLAADPPSGTFGRFFQGQLCWQKSNGCAGDTRLYDWAKNANGNVAPILFTQRNGSTLSGHVWWTNRGRAKRPGVVITNGSVQAPEELYWFAAQTLAKAGYVVMTWDPQGQGYSDTFGEGDDRGEGFPSQSGGPFYDGTEDALDFFFSAPGRPYRPRDSCGGRSHADKQVARVKDGRSSAYNPAFKMLDPSRVGIAGHSLGAAAVSYVGQRDRRVKAIVAWDTLSDASAPRDPNNRLGPSACGADQRGPTPLRVPALGITGDYPIFGPPNLALPDRKAKQAGYLAQRRAGLDSGQIAIRGGGHFEFSYIANQAFLATLRGMDLVSWYTTAWMDRYVKRDASAQTRLTTDRWRSDSADTMADPADHNLYSTYLDSPLDTGDFHCSDLRGCAQARSDGSKKSYSYLATATSSDARAKKGATRGTTSPAGSPGAPPAATGASASTAPRRDGG